MDYQTNTAEIASKQLTYVASGAGLYFGMSANELAAFASVIIAFLAFVINALITWHFKAAHLRLAQERAVAVDEVSGD